MKGQSQVHSGLVHRRRSVRLKGYDYSQPGAYFVTIVTHAHRSLFGRVASGEMHLSRLGKIARDCWRQIPDHFAQIELGSFAVMPNHLHGILILHERSSDSPPTVGAHHGVPLREPNTEGFGRPVQGSMASIMRQYKSSGTRQILRDLGASAPVWQRGYYDHVIRNEAEWNLIHRYIVENPAKWAQDSERLREADLGPTQP